MTYREWNPRPKKPKSRKARLTLISKPAYKRIKNGNQKKFDMLSECSVGPQTGYIVDYYVFQNVYYYKIKWDIPMETWYGKRTQQKPAEYGWYESRLIKILEKGE